MVSRKPHGLRVQPSGRGRAGKTLGHKKGLAIARPSLQRQGIFELSGKNHVMIIWPPSLEGRFPDPPKSKTSWLNLVAAISQYFSSRSIPTADRPIALAATNVVPLPIKGSRTDFASGKKPIHHFIRDNGFIVGCNRSSLDLPPYSWSIPFQRCLKIRTALL